MNRITAVVMIVGLTGCAGVGPLVRPSGAVAEVETRLWQDKILRHGKDGDWLVIRGYNSADHLVAIAGNAELTHVGVLDARHAAVVEATSPEVREVSLQTFLEGADRVLLVRPGTQRNSAFSSTVGFLVASPQVERNTGSAALAKARTQIGARYDTFGTLGLPEPGKFYCSELAAWSTGHEVDVEWMAGVLHPADMSNYGQILFDSESRKR